MVKTLNMLTGLKAVAGTARGFIVSTVLLTGLFSALLGAAGAVAQNQTVAANDSAMCSMAKFTR